MKTGLAVQNNQVDLDRRFDKALFRLKNSISNIDVRISDVQKEASWFEIVRKGLKFSKSASGMIALITILKPVLSTRMVGILSTALAIRAWLNSGSKRNN